MSISQGQRAIHNYTSQFETLLGRLDSYDEGLMINQFIWGLQLDLARSVSMHYPNSIAKAVSLAETMELAFKASRRPNWKGSTVGNQTNGPNQSNRGRGQWRGRGGSRGGFRGGSSVGSSGSTRGNSGGTRGRGRHSYSANFDPLACYQCGVHDHLAPRLSPSRANAAGKWQSRPFPKEVRPIQAKNAQEEEEQVGQFGSGASMSYMTRLEMNI